MSTIDMTQVAGLQTVDAEGNVIGTLSVDDLTNLVANNLVKSTQNQIAAARSVSTMSEASTLAASDDYENTLPIDANPASVRTLDAAGNPKQTGISALAQVVGGLIGEAKYNKSGLLGSKNVSIHEVLPAYEVNPNKALKIGVKKGLTLLVSIATGASFSNLYYVTLEDIDLISRMNVHTLYRGSEGNDLKIYYKDGCIYIQSRYSGSPSCIQPLVNNGITSIVNNVDFDKSNMIEASYQ